MKSVYAHGAARGYTDPHTFACLCGGQRSNSVPPTQLFEAESLTGPWHMTVRLAGWPESTGSCCPQCWDHKLTLPCLTLCAVAQAQVAR